VPGSTGEFTVLAGGKKLWDKFESGRFPEDLEVLEQFSS
jgi:predicted Rdx family selenoprotein